MENTGFYVIPNKTQYEIGERVWLEIKKTGPTKANHVKVSLFTYQGENLKMECTLEQGVSYRVQTVNFDVEFKIAA